MVHIIADTTCVLPLELCKQLDITIMPQIIINTLRQKRKQERMYFMVDTLEYLAKGGRIGNVKALVGGLLQFKPIQTLKNGINSPFENQRTRLKAINRLVQLASEIYPANITSRLNIVHSDDKETALKISDKLRTKLSIDETPIYDQCASILTHVGPGAIALSYFDENFNNEVT